MLICRVTVGALVELSLGQVTQVGQFAVQGLAAQDPVRQRNEPALEQRVLTADQPGGRLLTGESSGGGLHRRAGGSSPPGARADTRRTVASTSRNRSQRSPPRTRVGRARTPTATAADPSSGTC